MTLLYLLPDEDEGGGDTPQEPQEPQEPQLIPSEYKTSDEVDLYLLSANKTIISENEEYFTNKSFKGWVTGKTSTPNIFESTDNRYSTKTYSDMVNLITYIENNETEEVFFYIVED